FFIHSSFTHKTFLHDSTSMDTHTTPDSALQKLFFTHKIFSFTHHHSMKTFLHSQKYSSHTKIFSFTHHHHSMKTFLHSLIRFDHTHSMIQTQSNSMKLIQTQESPKPPKSPKTLKTPKSPKTPKIAQNRTFPKKPLFPLSHADLTF
ncbi:MAG TPA: hypothetical protein VN906_08845, partial [Candidatus Sulfotelmatobacter sp.]|nr:hypothetical protein [Candidatus Sulfotelmatobacter sp.]